jgi:arylformamidase|tara:strand:- start:4640 stop:5515 length:876 start_codon:yes stop_codon:yes gene_type:complete
VDQGDEGANWQAMTPAEREVAYSPSSCIGGDYSTHLAEYRDRSAVARATVDRWQEYAYGPARSNHLDLFLPAGTGEPPPLLVFIHGGYWQELSKEDSAFAAPAWVDRGVAFAAIGYTLAPKATLYEIVAECRKAVGWLHEHADEVGIDRRRIVVAGSSAGAHLAALVALSESPASATVLISGVFDLRPLVGTSIVEALDLTTADANALSPALASIHGFPPSLVCWGEVETDEFKEQGRRFAEFLNAAGTTCTSFEVGARNHFDVVLDLADPSSKIGRAVASFLDGSMSGSS